MNYLIAMVLLTVAGGLSVLIWAATRPRHYPVSAPPRRQETSPTAIARATANVSVVVNNFAPAVAPPAVTRVDHHFWLHLGRPAPEPAAIEARRVIPGTVIANREPSRRAISPLSGRVGVPRRVLPESLPVNQEAASSWTT